MRSLILLTVFLCSIVSLAQEKRSTFVKDQPLPKKVVNDFGKFLTKPEKASLEIDLISFRERKGYSVVIITLPGLTDNKGTEFTIEETAQLYFNKWGIGDNVKNDGVLIMLSKKPRRIRIHTGIGMATLLTNANCASIINKTMVPNFKADLYFTGLNDAVKDIEKYVNENEAANTAQQPVAANAIGTQQAEQVQEIEQSREEFTFSKFMYVFIISVTLVWLFFRYIRKKANPGAQGVYSGSGFNAANSFSKNINRTSNNNWGGGSGNSGGSGRRKSWFNSGGSNDIGWFSGSSVFSSGSSDSSSSYSSSDDSSSSSSSSSGSASDSYSGGSSDGGGASGSW